MDFKKLFRKDEKAVSPVIGVILMVAITVILAAAIGSSVFSKGTAESAPQANFNIKAGEVGSDAGASKITIEHLGGDDVHFEVPSGGTSATKIVAAVNGVAYTIDAADASNELGTMKVGDTKTLTLNGKDSSSTPVTGPTVTAGTTTVNIKFIDVQTNQLIADKNVRF
ncbi:MAG: type IV pilin [Methanosarcina sp.]|nr:type IV pilin [Methanosarcina sp.]